MSAPVYSPQVNWWEVHTFVTPMLTAVGSWPLVGTPTWCALGDDDPVKWAATFDAAQHWALRVEANQEARAEAGRDIAASTDWLAISRRIRERAEFCNAHPWMKQVKPGA